MDTGSSKAFDILSSTIYSNKLLAPIRELSTNAWDANVDNGKNGWDFEVYVPDNDFTGLFSIRDYGMGISKEEMLSPNGIFTTYFKSSKEDGKSNGFLGLGSKSPFAITNVFYVTSYCEGYKREYQLDKGSGKPVISLASEQLTDEPTGLQISFRVPLLDLKKFEEEIVNFYSFWDNKPNFNREINFKKITRPLINNKPLKCIEDNKGLYCLMGNTPYKISSDQIHWELSKFTYQYETSVVLEAELGEVDFTASRESLESTPKTLEWLANKLNILRLDIVKEVTKLNELPFTDWVNRSTFPQILEEICKSPLYGKDNFCDFKKKSFCITNSEVSLPLRLPLYLAGRFYPLRKNYRNNLNQIKKNSKVVFFYNDGTKETKRKIIYYSTKNPDVQVVPIYHLSFTSEELGTIIYPQDIEIPVVERRSSIRNSNTTRRKLVRGITKFRLRDSFRARFAKNPIEVGDLPHHAYYLFTDDSLQFLETTNYKIFEDLCGSSNPEIYFVDRALHAPSKNWDYLSAYLQKELSNKYSNELQLKADLEVLNKYNYSEVSSYFNDEKTLEILEKVKEIKKKKDSITFLETISVDFLPKVSTETQNLVDFLSSPLSITERITKNKPGWNWGTSEVRRKVLDYVIETCKKEEKLIWD